MSDLLNGTIVRNVLFIVIFIILLLIVAYSLFKITGMPVF